MPVDRAMLTAELQKSFAPAGAGGLAGPVAGNIAAYTGLDAAAAEARRNLQSNLWNMWYERTKRRMRHNKKDFRSQMKYGVLGALLGAGSDIAFEALKPGDIKPPGAGGYTDYSGGAGAPPGYRGPTLPWYRPEY